MSLINMNVLKMEIILVGSPKTDIEGKSSATNYTLKNRKKFYIGVKSFLNMERISAIIQPSQCIREFTQENNPLTIAHVQKHWVTSQLAMCMRKLQIILKPYECNECGKSCAKTSCLIQPQKSHMEWETLWMSSMWESFQWEVTPKKTWENSHRRETL